METGAGAGTQTPNLSTHAGSVILTWQQADPPTVVWQGRDGTGAWTTPRTLVTASDLFINWADFPLMAALDGNNLMAAWLQRSSPDAYGVQLSHSSDAGKTWTSPRWLHDHTGGPEYGFVSMTGLRDGGMRAFWLDGRASGGHHGGGAMQLRAATVGADGTVTDRILVDDRVCDCCQTAAATTSLGPVVVYRDRSDHEVRDIALAGPGRDQRRAVAADNWKIAGCPVNGPSVAAGPSGLAVAWFSAGDGKAAVAAAFASEQGDFGPPISVGLAKPMGRVDVDWLDEERALVSFIDGSGDDGATLVARAVRADGWVGPPWRIAGVSASNASGFPRMVRAGDSLVWAWTAETPDGPTVRLAEAPVAALAAD